MAGQRFLNPFIQFMDSQGLPRAGGLLYFYLTGSSTAAPTYSDPSLSPSSINSNPIILNELGQSDTAIWLDPAIQYKVQLKNADGSDVWTADPNYTLQFAAAFNVIAGNPNGQRAGSAGTPGVSLSDVVWDVTTNTLYVCTTTGDATTAVWTAVGSSLGGSVVFASDISVNWSSNQDDANPDGLSGTSVMRVNATTTFFTVSGLATGVDGRDLTIYNVGSTGFSLLPESSASVAANRFAFASIIFIPPNNSVHIRYDGISSRWRLAQRVTGNIPVPLPRNLTISNGGTPNNQVSIQWNGPISLYDPLGQNSDITVFEAGFGTIIRTAATNTGGANGLDTGVVAANTWYSVWVIFNPSTGALASLLSLSSTSPALPAGYTYQMRLGWVRTDGSSNLLRIAQRGNIAKYVITAATNTANLPSMQSGASGNPATPVWTAVSVSNFVPPTAIGILGVIRGTNPVIAAPNNAYGGTGATPNIPPVMIPNGGNAAIPFEFILETSNIFYAAAGADGQLSCSGWRDQP